MLGHVVAQAAPSSRAEQSAPERVLGLIAAALLFVLSLVAKAFGAVFRLFGTIVRSSRIAAAAVAIVAVLCVGGLVDLGLNWGKIYSGVSIGTVDVSGMTVDEASAAVRSQYEERLSGGQVYIFADEDIAQSVDIERQIVQDEALAEQLSFEEAQKSKKLWQESAEALGATLPADELAASAFAVGREGSGPIDRIAALFGGWTVGITAHFGDEQIETLAADIDSAIGTVRVDYNIEVVSGVASVVAGHDGSMVNRDWLKERLAEALLVAEDGRGNFVAQTEYAPLRIDEAAAQATCDAVNALIAGGAAFDYDGHELTVSRENLGSWVSTRLEAAPQGGEGYLLAPFVDSTKATPSLVSLVNKEATGADVSIDFEVDGDVVTVTPVGEVTVPLLTDALAALDDKMFGAFRSTLDESPIALDPIEITTQVVSGPMTFDEALSYGIVTEITSYTTQFVNSTSTANRNHNIRLAAQLLNNSVAQSNGGKWSFNATAGNCNEEAGFLPAGAISGDEYIDEAGGGICQVATTVFNAVYDGGYPMVSRMNHTLYVASYPAGRDAAVSYPDLDFVWRNDTSSDVLLRTSTTETSVTVTLYGVDPGYTVETETGEWIEGKKFETKTTVDETMAPGTSVTKTAGTNGMEITVVRTVKAKDGSVVRQDSFRSIYSPVNEVIVKGPDKKEDGESKDQAAAA